METHGCPKGEDVETPPNNDNTKTTSPPTPSSKISGFHENNKKRETV